MLPLTPETATAVRQASRMIESDAGAVTRTRNLYRVPQAANMRWPGPGLCVAQGECRLVFAIARLFSNPAFLSAYRPVFTSEVATVGAYGDR